MKGRARPEIRSPGEAGTGIGLTEYPEQPIAGMGCIVHPHSAVGFPAEVPARGAFNKALVEERVDAVTAPNDADAADCAILNQPLHMDVRRVTAHLISH